MENTPTAMTALLEAATALFSWVFTSLTTVITTITGSPLLLMGFLCSLVGLVVGIFKRLSNIG